MRATSELPREELLLLPALQSMRVDQWVKNLFVVAPAFFAGVLTVPASFLSVTLTFVAFCLAASACYLMNDLHDRERDREHPRKALRPIASGRLPVPTARFIALSLGVTSVTLPLIVSQPIALWVVAYLALNVAYTRWLKHVVILDVFCIACGFVLRIGAGAAAAAVHASAWIVMATFLLALFLALTRRRQEIAVAFADHNHRPVLQNYSLALLDQLIAITTPATILTYILYTLDADTIARHGSDQLFLTALPVIFGVFRYLFLVHQRGAGEAPASTLFNDGPLLAAIATWIASFAGLIYFGAA